MVRVRPLLARFQKREAPGLWLYHAACNSGIELCHEKCGGVIRDAPEAYQKRCSAGSQEGPHESEQLVSSQELLSAGLASAHGYKISGQPQPIDLRQCEPSVRKQDAGKQRLVFLELPVSCD